MALRERTTEIVRLRATFPLLSERQSWTYQSSYVYLHGKFLVSVA